MSIKNPSIALFVGIYALTVLLLHFIFSQHDLQRFVLLAERGIKIEGYVAGKMCDDHGYYLYKFRVNNQSYYGDKMPHGYNCDELKIGDSVDVWYLPDDPSVNTTSDPAIHLDSRTTSDWIGAFWLSLIVFGLHPKLRRKKWFFQKSVK